MAVTQFVHRRLNLLGYWKIRSPAWANIRVNPFLFFLRLHSKSELGCEKKPCTLRAFAMVLCWANFLLLFSSGIWMAIGVLGDVAQA